MKKDYSLLSITMSIVCSACIIGVDAIYWKHFPAFYLACVVIGSIAVASSVTCLAFRLKNRNKEERYYSILTIMSMVSSSVAMLVTVVGTLITMFA